MEQKRRSLYTQFLDDEENGAPNYFKPEYVAPLTDQISQTEYAAGAIELLEQLRQLLQSLDIPSSMKFKTPIFTHCSETQALLRHDEPRKRTDYIQNLSRYFEQPTEKKNRPSYHSYQSLQSAES
jgi:hypothetical protein